MDTKKSKVKIYIEGLQQSEGQTDKNVIDVTGEAYEKCGKTFILYDEEGTSNLLKIGTDTIELLRRGQITTKMLYKKDYQDSFMYNTGYGAFLMSTRTSQLTITHKSDKISAYMEYDLYVDNIPTASYKMTIDIDWNI